MALCLIASNHVYRDLQQGGVCRCVHCEGFCSCESNTGPNGPWIENPKKRDEPVPHVHIEVALGECGARQASVSGGTAVKGWGCSDTATLLAHSQNRNSFSQQE